MQLPTQKKQIHVYGTKASDIQTDIDHYIANNGLCTGFKVITHDTTEYLWFDECTGTHQTPTSFRICKLEFDETKEEWIETRHTTCELIMFGKKMNTSVSHDALYAVFPAHMVLSDLDCRKILSGHERHTTITNLKHVLYIEEANYELHLHNRIEYIGLLKPPRFVYEHYRVGETNPEEQNHNAYMKDMVIARLDLNQNRSIGRDDIIASMVQKVVLNDNSTTAYRISDLILPIPTEQLQSMAIRNVKFRVGNQNPAYLFKDQKWDCKMDESSPVGRVRAHRLEFSTAL